MQYLNLEAFCERLFVGFLVQDCRPGCFPPLGCRGGSSRHLLFWSDGDVMKSSSELSIKTQG